MFSTAFLQKKTSIILMDVLILIVVYYIPTISHNLPIPLYSFEPMRIVLFSSIIVQKNRNNSFLLAFTLPIFSYFIAGHPVVIKNMIMSVELMANVFFLFWFLDKKINCFIACFASIFLSKLLYYFMKYIAIYFMLMPESMIETSIVFQIIISLALSAIFVVYSKKNFDGK